MTGPALAVDLVNLASVAWSVSTAEAVLADHEIRRRALDAESAAELRQWTALLRAVFDAPDETKRCRAVNATLESGVSRVHVTAHDALRPHLHFVGDEEDVVARVKAVTAGGLAIFLVESGGDRLGVCRRPACGLVYVDVSRNGRRAFCSARCGNTVAVARHRERRRG